MKDARKDAGTYLVHIISRQGLFKVCVVFITLLSFLLNTGGGDMLSERAWAAGEPAGSTSVFPDGAYGPGLLSPKVNIKDILIPLRFGDIKDVHNGRNGKNIIHIQDAHCNYSAQHSISNIIKYLSDVNSVDLVLLEGGVGRYDTSLFTDIPDTDMRYNISDYFVKQGRLNGAEYFAVNHPGSVRLYGIENEALYTKNLNAYRKSLSFKKDSDRILNTLTHYIQNLKRRMYPEKAINLDKKIQAYKDKNIKFKDYLESLVKTAKSRSVDFSLFKNMDKLVKLLGDEKSINFKKANTERRILIDKLRSKLSRRDMSDLIEKTLQFKIKNISNEDFYSYLFRKARFTGLDFSDLPNLQKYSLYIKEYDKLDKGKLFTELNKLQDTIIMSLLETDDQKTLYQLDKNLQILRDMFNVSLVKDEFDYYMNDPEKFNIKRYVDFIKAKGPINGINVSIRGDILNLDAYRDTMETFYACSLERDIAFMDSIQEELKKTKNKTAILVTGGFHTGNLKELFEQQGYSYISVMPRMDKIEGDNPYFGLLAGGKSEIETIITSNISQIAIVNILSEMGVPDRKTFSLAIQVMRKMARNNWEGTATLLLPNGYTVLTMKEPGKLEADNPGIYALTGMGEDGSEISLVKQVGDIDGKPVYAIREKNEGIRTISSDTVISVLSPNTPDHLAPRTRRGHEPIDTAFTLAHDPDYPHLEAHKMTESKHWESIKAQINELLGEQGQYISESLEALLQAHPQFMFLVTGKNGQALRWRLAHRAWTKNRIHVMALGQGGVVDYRQVAINLIHEIGALLNGHKIQGFSHEKNDALHTDWVKVKQALGAVEGIRGEGRPPHGGDVMTTLGPITLEQIREEIIRKFASMAEIDLDALKAEGVQMPYLKLAGSKKLSAEQKKRMRVALLRTYGLIRHDGSLDHELFYHHYVLRASNQSKSAWLASYTPIAAFVDEIESNISEEEIQSFARPVHNNGYWRLVKAKVYTEKVTGPEDLILGIIPELPEADMDRLRGFLTDDAIQNKLDDKAKNDRLYVNPSGYKILLSDIERGDNNKGWLDFFEWYGNLTGIKKSKESLEKFFSGEFTSNRIQVFNANAASWEDLDKDARKFDYDERIRKMRGNQKAAMASAFALTNLRIMLSFAQMDYATAVIWRYKGHWSEEAGWENEYQVATPYDSSDFDADRYKDGPIWRAVLDRRLQLRGIDNPYERFLQVVLRRLSNDNKHAFISGVDAVMDMVSVVRKEVDVEITSDPDRFNRLARISHDLAYWPGRENAIFTASNPALGVAPEFGADTDAEEAFLSYFKEKAREKYRGRAKMAGGLKIFVGDLIDRPALRVDFFEEWADNFGKDKSDVIEMARAGTLDPEAQIFNANFGTWETLTAAAERDYEDPDARIAKMRTNQINNIIACRILANVDTYLIGMTRSHVLALLYRYLEQGEYGYDGTDRFGKPDPEEWRNGIWQASVNYYDPRFDDQREIDHQMWIKMMTALAEEDGLSSAGAFKDVVLHPTSNVNELAFLATFTAIQEKFVEKHKVISDWVPAKRRSVAKNVHENGYRVDEAKKIEDTDNAFLGSHVDTNDRGLAIVDTIPEYMNDAARRWFENRSNPEYIDKWLKYKKEKFDELTEEEIADIESAKKHGVKDIGIGGYKFTAGIFKDDDALQRFYKQFGKTDAAIEEARKGGVILNENSMSFDVMWGEAERYGAMTELRRKQIIDNQLDGIAVGLVFQDMLDSGVPLSMEEMVYYAAVLWRYYGGAYFDRKGFSWQWQISADYLMGLNQSERQKDMRIIRAVFQRLQIDFPEASPDYAKDTAVTENKLDDDGIPVDANPYDMNLRLGDAVYVKIDDASGERRWYRGVVTDYRGDGLLDGRFDEHRRLGNRFWRAEGVMVRLDDYPFGLFVPAHTLFLTNEQLDDERVTPNKNRSIVKADKLDIAIGKDAPGIVTSYELELMPKELALDESRLVEEDLEVLSTALGERILSAEEFMERRQELKGAYALGMSKHKGVYEAICRVCGLKEWVSAYDEKYMTAGRTAEFLDAITAEDKPIVFFVPPGVLTNALSNHTGKEMEWFLDAAREGRADALKNVYFVFGAYDMVKDDEYDNSLPEERQRLIESALRGNFELTAGRFDFLKEDLVAWSELQEALLQLDREDFDDPGVVSLIAEKIWQVVQKTILRDDGTINEMEANLEGTMVSGEGVGQQIKRILGLIYAIVQTNGIPQSMVPEGTLRDSIRQSITTTDLLRSKLFTLRITPIETEVPIFKRHAIFRFTHPLESGLEGEEEAFYYLANLDNAAYDRALMESTIVKYVQLAASRAKPAAVEDVLTAGAPLTPIIAEFFDRELPDEALKQVWEAPDAEAVQRILEQNDYEEMAERIAPVLYDIIVQAREVAGELERDVETRLDGKLTLREGIETAEFYYADFAPGEGFLKQIYFGARVNYNDDDEGDAEVVISITKDGTIEIKGDVDGTAVTARSIAPTAPADQETPPDVLTSRAPLTPIIGTFFDREISEEGFRALWAAEDVDAMQEVLKTNGFEEEAEELAPVLFRVIETARVVARQLDQIVDGFMDPSATLYIEKVIQNIQFQRVPGGKIIFIESPIAYITRDLRAGEAGIMITLRSDGSVHIKGDADGESATDYSIDPPLPEISAAGILVEEVTYYEGSGYMRAKTYFDNGKPERTEEYFDNADNNLAAVVEYDKSGEPLRRTEFYEHGPIASVTVLQDIEGQAEKGTRYDYSPEAHITGDDPVSGREVEYGLLLKQVMPDGTYYNYSYFAEGTVGIAMVPSYGVISSVDTYDSSDRHLYQDEYSLDGRRMHRIVYDKNERPIRRIEFYEHGPIKSVKILQDIEGEDNGTRYIYGADAYMMGEDPITGEEVEYGLLERKVNPDGSYVEYTYFPIATFDAEQVGQVTPPFGALISAEEYNPTGQRLSRDEFDAEGQRIRRIEYDEAGKVLREITDFPDDEDTPIWGYTSVDEERGDEEREQRGKLTEPPMDLTETAPISREGARIERVGEDGLRIDAASDVLSLGADTAGQAKFKALLMDILSDAFHGSMKDIHGGKPSIINIPINAEKSGISFAEFTQFFSQLIDLRRQADKKVMQLELGNITFNFFEDTEAGRSELLSEVTNIIDNEWKVSDADAKRRIVTFSFGTIDGIQEKSFTVYLQGDVEQGVQAAPTPVAKCIAAAIKSLNLFDLMSRPDGELAQDKIDDAEETAVASLVDISGITGADRQKFIDRIMQEMEDKPDGLLSLSGKLFVKVTPIDWNEIVLIHEMESEVLRAL